MGRRRKTGLCACGSRSPYRGCCGAFIDGDELPQTPEQLMRSRYSAYAFGDSDYIIETTDPDGAAWSADRDAWVDGIDDFHRSCTFLGVDILEASARDDHGEVLFKAKLKRGRDDATFRERSTFARRDGRWFYVSGAPE